MNAKTLISSICILLAICLAFYFYAEWQKQRFDAALPVPPPPPAQETGGHWPGDEWHTDDAHTGELIPGDDWPPNTPRGGVLAMVPVVRLAVFCPPPRCVLPTEAGVKAVQQKRLFDNFAGEPLYFFCIAGDFACKRAASSMCRSVKLQK